MGNSGGGAKEGEFLGVVIVQAPDIHEAVQVAWRKKINPGGEVFGGANT